MNPAYIKPKLSYIKAGKLLHLITLIEVIIGVFVITWLVGLDTEGYVQTGLKLYGIIFFSSLPIFAQLDARSRYQNYKQLRDQLVFYGYDNRIMRPIIKSRCQRDAAILAAYSTGYKSQCLFYFRKAGYRWYHLFPDFLFSNPEFLFTKYFWKTTFFCPTYHSKLNQEPALLLHSERQVIPSIIQNGSTHSGNKRTLQNFQGYKSS